MNLLLSQIHVVDPKNKINDVMDVLIKKGKVSSIKKKIEVEGDDVRIFDGKGKYLFPGLIDMHVHFREPGFEGKETIQTGSKAAIKGGIVAVVTMPNTQPACDHASIIDNIIRKANEVPFYIFPAATITKGREGKELSEMADLKMAGAIAVTDDGSWVHDSLLMRRALEYASMLELLVVSHAEDQRLSLHGVMSEGCMSTELGLRGIPAASEEVAVARDLILANLTGARLHMTHLSAKGSIDMIRAAKMRGVKVTCDVTPHHIALTDKKLANYDTNFKMYPPLRQNPDQEAIIEGLKDGTIDAIATDHAPHTEEEKMREFQDAPVGVIGVETSLAVCLTELYHKRKFALEDVVNKMSVHPAQILKLPSGFGEIKTGTEANLTIVDVGQEWEVNKKEIISKSKNSSFIGQKLKGRVLATICRGRLWDFASHTESAEVVELKS